MSGKWLRREGDRWVREGIVTPEQLARIEALYESKDRGVGLLALLGGLLLGLGVLSFVAANWQALANPIRIAILLAAMLGFYAAGGRLVARGRDGAGVALVGVGLFAFGGGLVLVNQMFHLIMYSAATLVVWAAAGAALAYVFRSRYLYLVAVVLTFVAQGYSLGAFGGRFSFAAFAVLLLGLAPFLAVRRDAFAAAVWSLGAVLHALLLVLSMEWAFGWWFLPLLLLYAAADAVPRDKLRLALQLPPVAGAFVFALVLALAGDAYWTALLHPHGAAYLPAYAALLAASVYLKRRRGDLPSLVDGLLFLPLLYAPPAAIGPLYLAALFLFALATLLLGYREESRLRINAGTVAFLLATMAAYFKLTWGFLDKSAFFLLGGVLLLGLGWLLNRRKRVALHEAKEE